MEILLKASAVTALFYLSYKLFLQRETFFESNRLFLLIGIALSVLIPFLVIPIYIESTSITNFVVTSSESTIQTIAQESFDYFKLFPLIYGLGVTFFLTKLVIEFTSLFKLISNKSVKTTQTAKLIETEEATSPFSFFNYIVYNPNQFNDSELNHIINHEQVHARQWHSVDIILIQLATVAFWFNPFIWLYKKDLQQNLEFIADKNAQSISSCHKSYQHLLLKATIPNQQLVLVNNFYNSLIKKRIVMLHKTKSHKLNVLKYALVIPLLGLFLMSFNTKEIYIESEHAKLENKIGDIEVVIITKDSKDADLENVKKEFKSKGVTLKFKGIKRNAKGEIIAIKITASTSKSNANYNISGDDGIKPIKITYNSKGESISIGNSQGLHDGEHDYYFKSKDGNHKIVTSGTGSNVFVISEEHEVHDEHDGKKKYKIHKEHKVHDAHDSQDVHKEHHVEVIIEDKDGNQVHDENVFINKKTKVIRLDSDGSGKNEKVYIIKKDKDGNTVKEIINLNDDGTHSWIEEENKDAERHEIIIKNGGSKDGMIFISSDENESPLILIDGKESTREDMQKLNPDSIEKMEVLKGDSATATHGEKGKDGVIIITTKKK